MNKIVLKIIKKFFWYLLPLIPCFSVVFTYKICSFKTNIENKFLIQKINEELGDKTIDDLTTELNHQKENLKNYVSNIEDYADKLENMDSTISDLNIEIENLNNNLNAKNEELTTLQNQNTTLQNQYTELSTFKIASVATINQYPNYPNGCEGIALQILLNYYGVNVSSEDVMNALSYGEKPYVENGIIYGGNPNYEFLGDPRKSDGWGIWDQGLANTASKFKSGIINGTGSDFDKILSIVKQNRPVIVWTSINLKTPYIVRSWIYKPTGEVIDWKSYNHAVVVIGFNDDSIIISDPIDGTIKYQNRSKFISVYNYMGKKAIYY